MDANPDKVPGVLLEDSVEVTCIKEKIEGGEILKATELVIIRSDIHINRVFRKITPISFYSLFINRCSAMPSYFVPGRP